MTTVGTAAVVTLAALLTPPASSAFTVTADTEKQLCRVDANSPSQVRDFWNKLENDVRKARIAEIDKASPGFAADLAAYESGREGAPTVNDLQQRITNTGGQEGLGMLTTQTAADAGIDAATDPGFRTEYTSSRHALPRRTSATTPPQPFLEPCRTKHPPACVSTPSDPNSSAPALPTTTPHNKP